jgi:hypothetical protein
VRPAGNTVAHTDTDADIDAGAGNAGAERLAARDDDSRTLM